jgi:hypothetical protein
VIRGRVWLVCMAGLLAIGLSVCGQASSGASANLSEGRSFGFGMQVGLPYGGLVSGRYWLSSEWGLEGIVFAGGETGDLDGTVSGRVLYRVSDAEVVDFYVAAGATVPLRDSNIAFSLLGGIEFGFRFASSLAWNIEFGGSITTRGAIDMAVGTGIHFYFPSE